MEAIRPRYLRQNGKNEQQINESLNNARINNQKMAERH